MTNVYLPHTHTYANTVNEEKKCRGGIETNEIQYQMIPVARTRAVQSIVYYRTVYIGVFCLFIVVVN